MNAEKTSDKLPFWLRRTSSQRDAELTSSGFVSARWTRWRRTVILQRSMQMSSSSGLDSERQSGRCFLPDKSVRGKWDAAVCSVSPLSCWFITECLSDETLSWTSLMNTWLHSADTNTQYPVSLILLINKYDNADINELLCTHHMFTLSCPVICGCRLFWWVAETKRFKFKTFI